MPHYYGSSKIDTSDFPREGRQGIDTSQPRSAGQTFNARINLISKIGSVFSLFCDGQRYGSARVVGEPCKDPKYQQDVHGHGQANMADHVYTFEVEHSEFDAPVERGEYVDPST